MKHLANQNGRLDGEIRILLKPSMCACFGGVPLTDCSVCKPDRNVAAIAQCLVVSLPDGQVIFGPGELVAATLDLFDNAGWNPSTPVLERISTPTQIVARPRWSCCVKSLR